MSAQEERTLYADFLGRWVLIPESCEYEQGEPPRSGTYVIRDDDGMLVFEMAWVDVAGNAQKATFSGVPDGTRAPFSGGALADALSITAVSDRELNSSAFKDGKELMVAQRQLDQSKQAMRVIQLVRFPDGTDAANVSVYRRVQ